MFGQLNEEQIEQLLGKQVLGRLGCHALGLTYVVPISYAYNDGYIYCHSEEGLKLSILRKNRQVCFQVDDTRDLSNWQSVICWGEFEELSDPIDKRRALAILNARNFPMATSRKMRLSAEWPFDEKEIDRINGVFFRIKVSDRTGRYERADSHEHLTG